jgi:hypothetical protein
VVVIPFCVGCRIKLTSFKDFKEDLEEFLRVKRFLEYLLNLKFSKKLL